MLKIKFRIVFSKIIDCGNARVVFIFLNCSKDRVHYTIGSIGSYFGISMDSVMVLKYFMKTSATSLSSDTISFFSSKIIFLSCLIVCSKRRVRVFSKCYSC